MTQTTTLLAAFSLAMFASSSLREPAPSAAAAAAQRHVLVNYFSNANMPAVPDGTVHITNPGSNVNGGGICANIYVFPPTGAMAECCSCNIAPNELRTLSINTDLAS